MKLRNPLSSKPKNIFPKEVQDQLRRAFSAMTQEVFIHFFREADQNPEETKVAREMLESFVQLSDKIKFKEYDLSHEKAAEYKVTRGPALVFAPDRYRIQYVGIPLGEEGRTLVETVILTGMGTGRLNEQAEKMVRRIDSARKVMVFVSQTCPYCPQQAINAVKAAVENPKHVSVKLMDTGFNPDLAQLYKAFSVPQTYANDILIGQGAQPEELFAASLEALEEKAVFIPENDAEFVEADLVIVGGGPAGLTAGIYAARSGLSTVIVERSVMGGQVATTPVVENYPGLSSIGGRNLVDIMVAHALEYVSVFPREAVMEINTGERIEVVTTLRRFSTRALLLATGASHRKLGAEGESRLSGRGVSYCSTCDGPLFKGKKVFMAGGGDSAVTEALHLNHLGADVTLVHRRDKLRAQDHLVAELEHHNIPILWNTEIKEIQGQDALESILLYDNRTQETRREPAEGLFVAVGYDPEVELARKLGLELTEDGYIKTDGRHRTSLAGVYSAGDVEGGFKQIVTAAGAGAAAAMTIFEDLSHPYWKKA